MWATLLAVAWGQSVRFVDDTSAVTLRSGFDHSIAPLGLGVAHRVTVADRPLVFALDITTPMLRPDLHDLRLRAGSELDLLPAQGWMVRASHGWTGLLTQNHGYGAQSLRWDLGTTVGWSAPRWVLGVEGVLQNTLVTVIHTTEWAREIGGSPSTRSTLWTPSWGGKIGLRTAATVGPVELGLRLGWDRMGKYNLALPPVYATAEAGLRW